MAYEYQRKVAAHTGWTYEYVEDSWPNLFQKLVAGEIDLLSDVSYTEERETPQGTSRHLRLGWHPMDVLHAVRKV